jgi:TonB family protein
MIERLVFCLVALVPASASAQTTQKQPTGKWVVEYADKMCVLQRDYGTRSEPLVLALRAIPMGDGVTAYVLDAPTRQRGAYVWVKIGFGPSAPTIEKQLATFDIAGFDLRFNETSLKRDEIERAFGTATLSFKARKRLNVSFAVPRLETALKALDECTVNLMDSWGFSRERQAAMAKRPELLKPIFNYFSGDDYPNEALRKEQSGSNSARYRIDVKGRVSGCTIVESSNSASLDGALCKVLKRVRYRPAVDRAGNPMESIGFTRMRWLLG